MKLVIWDRYGELRHGLIGKVETVFIRRRAGGSALIQNDF